MGTGPLSVPSVASAHHATGPKGTRNDWGRKVKITPPGVARGGVDGLRRSHRAGLTGSVRASAGVPRRTAVTPRCTKHTNQGLAFVRAASAGMLGPAQAGHPDGTPDRLGVGSHDKGDGR